MWAAFTRDQFGGDGGKQTWTAIYNPENGNLSDELVQTNHDSECQFIIWSELTDNLY